MLMLMNVKMGELLFIVVMQKPEGMGKEKSRIKI